eukprot:1715977-Pleurochrysis_carterae.AAC.4
MATWRRYSWVSTTMRRTTSLTSTRISSLEALSPTSHSTSGKQIDEVWSWDGRDLHACVLTTDGNRDASRGSSNASSSLGHAN